MGLYDREYYREEQSGFRLHAPTTIVGALVLLNFIVWIADYAVDFQLTKLLGARVETLSQPWLWWQFLTYGFLHSPGPSHIIFNMLGLWIFGREIESTYGRKEFLRLYLAMVVVSAAVWALVLRLQGFTASPPLVGASGAVSGVVILYVLLFRHRTLLLMFVLPVPAWLVGVLFVIFNAMGALGYSEPGDGPQVAYTAHLAGAAFAFLYFWQGWNLGRWVPGGLSLGWLKPRPRLRVHDPADQEESDDQQALNDEVDRILEKIHQSGEASLTRRERQTLESASRQYQRKRRRPGPNG